MKLSKDKELLEGIGALAGAKLSSKDLRLLISVWRVIEAVEPDFINEILEALQIAKINFNHNVNGLIKLLKEQK